MMPSPRSTLLPGQELDLISSSLQVEIIQAKPRNQQQQSGNVICSLRASGLFNTEQQQELKVL